MYLDNPLECGCDMAWIFADSNYYNLITDGDPDYSWDPTCANGTLFSQIDGQTLVEQCIEK